MVESDWGDVKKDLDPHFAKAICCTRAARCKCKKIPSDFSSGQCTTLFCTLLFAPGKRGVGLAVAGVQALHRCALWGQVQVGTPHCQQCATLLLAGPFEPFSWHRATTTGLSHGMFQPSSPPYYPHNCWCREWNFGTTVITLCPCVNSSNTVIRQYQECCAGSELWLCAGLSSSMPVIAY